MNEISSVLKEGEFAAELAQLILAAQGQQRIMPDLTLGLLHKLNNVMTSLYFTSEGCESEVEPEHPIRGMLADLTAAVRDAQKLVNQTAEVNHALGNTDSEYQDLNALLTQEVFLIRMLLPKSALVEVDSAVDSPIIKISTADFRWVIFNLAINARDVAKVRPHIRLKIVSADQLDLSEYTPSAVVPQPDAVALVFQDNGQGISPDIADRVFEPFFTTRSGRLGLGLFHAQNVAQRNGGALITRRNATDGAEFVWILPRITE